MVYKISEGILSWFLVEMLNTIAILLKKFDFTNFYAYKIFREIEFPDFFPYLSWLTVHCNLIWRKKILEIEKKVSRYIFF